MTLTLNTTSGVLHRSARCAGRDTRFHWVFEMRDELMEVEEIVAVSTASPTRPYVLVDHRCRKCLR